MISSSGHTVCSGVHRSTASAWSGVTDWMTSSSSLAGFGNTTLAQTPSPSTAPRTCESRCASQRSTPFAGTATMSGANGSAGGVDSTSARPRASVAASDDR